MTELVVLARIAGRRIAVNALDVQSVVDLEEITRVPGAPAHVAGVTALRSRALTVIDMHLAIGEPTADGGSGRALVIEHEGHGYALMVEDVADIVQVEGPLKPVPGGLSHQWREIAAGLIETSAGPALLIDCRAALGAKPVEPV